MAARRPRLRRRCLPSTISTTTALTSSLNPSAYGQQVTFSATVSPSSGATGTVTFMDGASTLRLFSAQRERRSGVLDVDPRRRDTLHHRTVQRQYHRTEQYHCLGALSNSEQGRSKTITLTSPIFNPSKSGRLVTFTATVSPSTASTGTVEFSTVRASPARYRCPEQQPGITLNVIAQRREAFPSRPFTAGMRILRAARWPF